MAKQQKSAVTTTPVTTQTQQAAVATVAPTKAATYGSEQVITVKAGTNPKRPGTKAHATFSLYANGQTVGQFLAAGGFRAALAWDVAHGFITIA